MCVEQPHDAELTAASELWFEAQDGFENFSIFSWVLMMIMSDFYFGFACFFAKPSEQIFYKGFAKLIG